MAIALKLLLLNSNTSFIRLQCVVNTPVIRLLYVKNKIQMKRGEIKVGANSDFIRISMGILDFIDAYGTIKLEYMEKIFPHSRKAVGYLIKNQRLFKSLDGTYISTGPASPLDKGLVAALGVLADVFGKVKSHAKAASPVQISFITHSNDYYEIIYVGYGMEAMVAATLETQQPAGVQDNECKGMTKRIAIIEDKKQIERLKVLQIARFALVSPDGGLSYFKGS